MTGLLSWIMEHLMREYFYVGLRQKMPEQGLQVLLKIMELKNTDLWLRYCLRTRF